MERLQKVIANYGYASRRKAEKLIVSGQVKVNDVVVRELGTKVSSSDIIQINNVQIDKNIGYEYYLLYKPRGVISSSKDEKGRKTVVDLIDTESRIYPIGRLDYDTTGIILLTNDGNLANMLSLPKSNIDKSYIAKVDGILKKEDIIKLKNGVIIDGYKTKKAKIKVKKIDKKNKTSIVEVTIHEGKNHQVKKMFEAIGLKVLKLKREKYANLDLTGLKVGDYRPLLIKEVKKLYSLVNNKNSY